MRHAGIGSSSVTPPCKAPSMLEVRQNTRELNAVLQKHLMREIKTEFLN